MAPKVNIFDADHVMIAPEGGSDTFGAKVTPVASHLGLSGLGAMYVEVEPGKRAFPFHNHLGNDEMFVILDGEGTYRYGQEKVAIKAGDVLGAPKGGPETAHQIINTGDKTLRYMGISTSNDPDIAEYPDSGKFAAMGVFPGASFFDAHIKHVGKREDSRDYWEGEDI